MLAGCHVYSNILDCSSQNLVTIPSSRQFDYSRFNYVNFMHNNLVVADIRGAKGVIFDLRQNPFMSCRAIRYDQSQVVYPCNPKPKVTPEDIRVKDDNDNSKSESQDDNGSNTRLVMIIFSIFGAIFALAAVGLLVWGARRRRRRQRALNRIANFFRGI